MMMFNSLRTQFINITNQQIPLEPTCFKYFSSMKSCSLITVRPYFDFLKIFIVDGFAIKFFFNAITDFVSNINILFQQIIIFNQKIHPLSFTTITSYISARFWKHYT